MTGEWTALDQYVLDQLWSFQDVNELVKNVIALASARGGNHDLGGSRSQGTRSSAAFVTVPEWRHPKILGAGLAGLTAIARVQYKTDDTGTSVDWQVVDIDNANAVVASGTVYNGSIAWQEESQTITLNADDHRYELQVKSSNDSADVYAVGRIEIYANS